MVRSRLEILEEMHDELFGTIIKLEIKETLTSQLIIKLIKPEQAQVRSEAEVRLALIKGELVKNQMTLAIIKQKIEEEKK